MDKWWMDSKRLEQINLKFPIWRFSLLPNASPFQNRKLSSEDFYAIFN